MIDMANMTTRRTDKEVLLIIRECIEREEVLSHDAIAQRLDCHWLTVKRSIGRLETLQRLQVDRTRKPNRYRIPE